MIHVQPSTPSTPFNATPYSASRYFTRSRRIGNRYPSEHASSSIPPADHSSSSPIRHAERPRNVTLRGLLVISISSSPRSGLASSDPCFSALASASSECLPSSSFASSSRGCNITPANVGWQTDGAFMRRASARRPAIRQAQSHSSGASAGFAASTSSFSATESRMTEMTFCSK